jgi:methyltransferase (TIGR00027 family)
MTIDPIAGTARWTAAMRAEESGRTDRLFTDPLAEVLAGEPGRELLVRNGNAPAIAIRTRFFDELVAKVAPAQLVLVAAGMDTRAYRLGLPPDTVVYELDRPELLELKESLLEDAGARPTCDRRPVATDLAGDWLDDLLAAGFDRDRPTLWSVEGLTYYLEATEVAVLLGRITGLSAPGSELLVDFLSESLLASPSRREWLARLAERGSPWRFGCEEPAELLADDWSSTVATLSSVGRALNRWPDAAPEVAQVFLVHAVRQADEWPSAREEGN